MFTGAAPALLAPSVTYLKIRAWSAPAVLISMVAQVTAPALQPLPPPVPGARGLPCGRRPTKSNCCDCLLNTHFYSCAVGAGASSVVYASCFLLLATKNSFCKQACAAAYVSMRQDFP